MSRHKMQRQFVEQAVETIWRKCRSLRLPRHSPDQSCHPLQPSRIVYCRSHPFKVNRLSAKRADEHFTAVTSCISSHGKNTI